MASENYPTPAVNEAMNASFYSTEGYAGERPIGGKMWLDAMERLCWDRAMKTFNLDKEMWKVNVQPLSGAIANLETFTALLSPGDRIMGLELTHGGHLSHGHQTTTKKISETAHRFEAIPYFLDETTGLIDYDELESRAIALRPRLIIAGASAYSRLIDYGRMRRIADKIGAFLHADMSHICGLVASGVIPGPFEACDTVVSTLNKTLRGPLGAVIFHKSALADCINRTVFPRFQSGTNLRNVIALAVALKQAQSTESQKNQQDVLGGARVLAEGLKGYGYKLVSGGTDTHLLLLDLRDKGISGARAEAVLNLAGISCNRNLLAGDPLHRHGGLRLGSAPMTTRGMLPQGFSQVARFLHKGIEIARKLSLEANSQGSEMGMTAADTKTSAWFRKWLGDGTKDIELMELRSDVETFVKHYPIPY